MREEKEEKRREKKRKEERGKRGEKKKTKGGVQRTERASSSSIVIVAPRQNAKKRRVAFEGASSAEAGATAKNESSLSSRRRRRHRIELRRRLLRCPPRPLARHRRSRSRAGWGRVVRFASIRRVTSLHFSRRVARGRARRWSGLSSGHPPSRRRLPQLSDVYICTPAFCVELLVKVRTPQLATPPHSSFRRDVRRRSSFSRFPRVFLPPRPKTAETRATRERAVETRVERRRERSSKTPLSILRSAAETVFPVRTIPTSRLSVSAAAIDRSIARSLVSAGSTARISLARRDAEPNPNPPIAPGNTTRTKKRIARRHIQRRRGGRDGLL